MGTILSSYGDAGYEHEGYVGQLLDDGTITGTYSSSTIPRMTGHVVAACGCGWTGTTRYPTRELFDEQAHDLALGEWEHTHAVPALSAAVRDRTRRLPRLLSSLAADLDAQREDATAPQRAAVLERTLRGLDDARVLAQDLLDHARGEHR
jgi:hypothetical protein